MAGADRRMLQNLNAARAAAKLDPAARKLLQRQALASQKSQSYEPYYSRVRFAADISGAGPYVLSFPAKKLLAFSYALSQSMASVGHTINASLADTNVNKPGESNGGEKVKIYGLSIMPSTDSDPEVLRRLLPKMSVSMVINGKDRFPVGRPEFCPGSGGLNGAGTSALLSPPWDGYGGAHMGFVTNGLPGAGNFYPLPRPLVWMPSGGADSLFHVELEQHSGVAMILTARAAGGAGALPTAWDPPHAAGDIGTFLDLVVRLHCRQESARSINR